MTHLATPATETTAIAALQNQSASSQEAPPAILLPAVDRRLLAMGRRVSRMVGATVVDGTGETLGKVEDLMITPDGEAPFAVLSIGGFLGIGTTHVAVRYGALQARYKLMLFRDATKESLKSLPRVSQFPGDRTSKVMGAVVVNEADQIVGSVNDLIVAGPRNTLFVILSLGSYRGGQCIVIPYSVLKAQDEQFLLAGATEDSLKSLPEFTHIN